MTRIMIKDNVEQIESNNNSPKKETASQQPNLFQGRTEATTGSAKFPDWDILPPYQFLNPRIKKQ